MMAPRTVAWLGLLACAALLLATLAASVGPVVTAGFDNAQAALAGAGLSGTPQETAR